MAFESVKKQAAEYAVEKAIGYISREPQKNIFTILNFLEKVAVIPEHINIVRSLKNHFQDNLPVMEQAQRIVCNPRMLSNAINSWVINGTFLGRSKREKISSEMGVSVPCLILIDPTSACNLRCEGCWAGEYNKVDRLEPELLNRIITEARELGIHWIVLSGGEPFCYPYLLEIAAEHTDSVFMVYTNGTLIDEKTADRLAELANLTPTISLEGWRDSTDARRGAGTFDKAINSMDLLRERGVFSGASLTVTTKNVYELFSDEFIDFLIEKGIIYIWSFHYIPVGRNPNIDLMITPEQRLWLVKRIRELRKNKPIFIADFWNDGEYTKGCIAGGRQYFHINAAGDVEPCAFVHFAVDNIKGKSLKEVLLNPFFKAYQKEQPFNDNHLAPCPIIDAPASLRRMIKDCGAFPTHPGAEQTLEGDIAEHLDTLSCRWIKLANEFKDGNVRVGKKAEGDILSYR